MHPDVFSQKDLTIELLEKIEAWVDTRVFGTTNMNSCALIPFADALNHSDCWIQMHTVNKSIHLKGD